ncbi:MAG: dTDP-4-dehydrorhamnose 3,5-epimerase [Spirochaetia bacterium]|nr:dTDP-4-dehydrorhamnose 3,5-epimerase [Spirochaetia bacterium]
MQFQKQKINNLILIVPDVHGDDRGFFMESYKKSVYADNGMDFDFVQDNHAKSGKNVLRGLHYQLDPMAQGKLVRVVRGAVIDVAVDVRRSSSTFGQHVAVELTADNKHIFWVPSGFAHAYITLEDNTEFLYKTTNEYSPEHERGIRFDDPDLRIQWPVDLKDIKVSERDRNLPLLKDQKDLFK